MAIPIKLVANLVGISAAVIVTGYVVNATFVEEAAPQCESRYAGATEFALRNEEGKKLSPIELQARLGLTEWGILDNAKVVETGEEVAPDALEVKIEKGTGSGYNPKIPRGGVGFQ
jgi:hypothetical protein